MDKMEEKYLGSSIHGPADIFEITSSVQGLETYNNSIHENIVSNKINILKYNSTNCDKNICLKIKKWYGRLGNNIAQLYNCIIIGIHYNCNISIPQHDFFTNTFIEISKNTKPTSLFLVSDSDYFSINEIPHVTSNCIKDRAKNILRKNFSIDLNSIEPMSLNDLVIYIRSGDIFDTNIHQSYAQPPLSFYINIINQNKFKNITLVSENNLNPCVDQLLKIFPKIQYKKNSLIDDIKIILSASNIIHGRGTFSSSLILLSKNIQKEYCFHDPYYDKLIFPWKNSKEQIKLMLSYQQNEKLNSNQSTFD